MVQTIILHHTTTDTNVPMLLFAGETAVGTGPTFTRLWAGDGAANRLLLSNNPLDSPIFDAAGGPFLPLAGGTLTGPLTLQAFAATALEPVPLGQLAATLGNYLPLAGGTLSGTLTVGLNNSPNAWLVLNGTASGTKGVYWDVGGLDRWGLYSSGAETGGNTGSQLTLSYYDDAGGTAGYIFTASRTGSGITFQSVVTLAADPIGPLEAATRNYVDGFLPLAGGTVTGQVLSPNNPFYLQHVFAFEGTDGGVVASMQTGGATPATVGFRNVDSTLHLGQSDAGGNWLYDYASLTWDGHLSVRAGGSYQIDANQVVGPQIAGWGTPTGGVRIASFPGGSATTAQCAEAIAQIITDLKTHGLLGA